MLDHKLDGACPDCRGTGIVSYWTESVNFEDQRYCSKCDAGRTVASKISELASRVTTDESLQSGKAYQLFKALSS
jgi:hypothetical protein